MQKGFTLLELIVVIIIIGVLATLGLGQYMRMVEKARSAEARSIIGAIRTEAATLWMQNQNSCVGVCIDTNLGIGLGGYPGPLRGNCGGTHLFAYGTTLPNANGLTIRAERCEAGGKSPNAAVGYNGWVQDVINFATGVDTVTQSAGY